ncbi:MAG: hypothetical protein ABIO70_23565 [Pseudomonadota bacterium]
MPRLLRCGPLMAAVLTVLLVLAFAWPLPLHFGSRILGPTQADFYGIAWGLDHVARELFAGRWPGLHTTALEFPRGTRLLVADLPEAILLAPVTRLFGPTAAFNLLALGHHALAAAAAWWCARRLGLGVPGRAITALAFAFAPALVGTTFNQNPDVTAWYWVPLAAGLGATATDARTAALAGLMAGAAAWCNPYAGVMAAVAAVLLLPGRSPGRWASMLGVLLLVGGAAALLAWWSVKDPLSAGHKPGGLLALHGAAHLQDLLDPWPEIHVNREWDVSFFMHPAYLGWSVLLFGLVGCWRARRVRWALLAGVGALMALGPRIGVSEHTALINPVWWLGGHLGLDRLWLYHRYTALAVLGLGLGAGSLADALGRRGWWLLPVLALDLLLLTPAWRYLGSVERFDDGACALLQELPPGPQFDVPPGEHELWLFGGTCTGNPVAAGINRPHSRFMNVVLSAAQTRGAAMALAALRQQGFRYLVYHPAGPRGALMDPATILAQPCEVARNAQGVQVLDISGCPANLPKPPPIPQRSEASGDRF